MNKLFLLTTTQKIDYDMYDSCVVVAKDADSARLITPDGKLFNVNEYHHSWATSFDQIVATLIGVATDDLKEGTVVIASFNAG